MTPLEMLPGDPHQVRPPLADGTTICPYCGVGCGLSVEVVDGAVSRVRGNAQHRGTKGMLCRKAVYLPQAVNAHDRLAYPWLREGRRRPFSRVSWEMAMGWASDRFSRIIQEHGPDSVGFYISGQLLTEDYYVVNKLAKGFIGTNNVDSNSRLCMSSAVAGYVGAFGTDGPPAAYADIGQAECIVLWGSNTAECHPVTFGRIRERKKEAGVSVVVVASSRTLTAEIADLHLQIKPGTDLALANAMLHVLLNESL